MGIILRETSLVLDDWYIKMDIDADTGLRVTPKCRARVISKTFLQPPREYAAWLTTRGYEAPPSRDCEGKLVAEASEQLSILSPLEGDDFASEALLDPALMRIPFNVGGTLRALYHWKLNGQSFVSAEPTYLWQPHPGVYTLELEGADHPVHFEVQ